MNKSYGGINVDLLRLWLKYVKDGDFENAINIDILHYEKVVKKNENTYYWEEWQRQTHSARTELTNRMVKAIPNAKNKSNKIRLGVVFNNYSGLAHEQQISRNLKYIIKNICKIDFDVIYLFGDSNNALNHAADLYGLSNDNVYFLNSVSYQNAAHKLGLHCKIKEYSSILYPSIFFLAYWMSLFLDHDNQKFLVMKYYPYQAGRIKDWAGGERFSNNLNDFSKFNFQQLPILDVSVSMSNLSNLNEENSESKKLFFGSISRPEKISNYEYNEFIKDVLKKSPDWSYGYTGRSESLECIPKSILSHSRCCCLGWVDPLDAINKFAIYLEPFPWGGGDMTLLALEAGRAYLTVKSKENLDIGIYPFIKNIADQNDSLLQYSFCQNKSELKERIFMLMSNKELREELGRAWAKAIRNYKPKNERKWIEFLIE